MLRVIISPAKKMLAGTDSFSVRDVPALSERSTRLLAALAGMDDAQLQELWKVSDKLLEPCLSTLADLSEHGLPLTADDLCDPAFSARVSPAILSYVGIQYQSMAPGVMDETALTWLAEHLRIISGLYGCVRPFDAVLPYRLEMGARLAVDGSRDLYAFWGDAIAREVCAADGGGSDSGAPAADVPAHVVNLASVEYAKAVLPRLPALGAACTTCIFGEGMRGGKPIQRSTASKTARGSMVRWMAENGIENAADLVRFDVGYRFAPELSSEGTLVFMNAETRA